MKFFQNLRIDPFLPIWLTPRIQAFWTFSYDSRNWTLFCHSKELNLLLFHDAKNWTHFSETQLNTFLFWSTELNILFEHDSQNWTFFFGLWLKELNRIFKICSKNWTLFTRRLKELNEPSSQNDSKNWTFFEDYLTPRCLKFFVTREMELFFNLDQGIEIFFSTISLKNDWPFLNMTLRIDWTLLKTQNWTFFQFDSRTELIFQSDSKNCLRFVNITRRIEPSFWICLNE